MKPEAARLSQQITQTANSHAPPQQTMSLSNNFHPHAFQSGRKSHHFQSREYNSYSLYPSALFEGNGS